MLNECRCSEQSSNDEEQPTLHIDKLCALLAPAGSTPQDVMPASACLPVDTSKRSTEGCRWGARQASHRCSRVWVKIPPKLQVQHLPGLTPHTNSRIGAGFDMLFFASEDRVLPSKATSPIGLLP